MVADLEALKEKLLNLEDQLAELLDQMQADVNLAKAIQKLLIPNQLPDIVGLCAYNKYISGSSHFTESFDIIATPQKKALWIVMFMTEGFGLSSLLNQTLLNLQSKKLLQEKEDMEVEELFDVLSVALSHAHNKGKYRLSTIKIDLATLKIYGVATGMPPILSQKLDSPTQKKFSLCCLDQWKENKLEPSHSSEIIAAHKAVQYTYQAIPGEKLFFMGAQWNANSSVAEIFAPLLKNETEDQSLLDQINSLSLSASKYMSQHHNQSDLSLIGIEIDSKKLHLA